MGATLQHAEPAPRRYESSASLGRLPAADGLRAVAAVMVLLQHVSFLTGATFHSAVGNVLARFDVAVPVFFALSGFLLGRPFVARLLDRRPLPPKAPFYRRRVLRIVPAYWLALTATYVWLRPDSARQAAGLDYPLHYLLLQIYPGGTFQKGISLAWSLAVEMSFYLVLPWLAALAARWLAGRVGVDQRARLLLWGLAGSALLSFAWRLAIEATGLPRQALLWLPGSFQPFALGMVAATVSEWSRRRASPVRAGTLAGRHDLAWWVLAAGLLAVAASSPLGLARGLDHASWWREMVREELYDGFALLLLLPVVFGPQDRGIVRRVLRTWPLAALGTVSYGFFLWHVPLIETSLHLIHQPMFLDWRGGLGFLNRSVIATGGLTFLLATAAAIASWFFVEKPLLRRSSGPPPATQAAP
jgi:peptidoglycan/LPS O-acetylase OafA/YrhL